MALWAGRDFLLPTGETMAHHHLFFLSVFSVLFLFSFFFSPCPAIRPESVCVCAAVRSAADDDSGRAGPGRAIRRYMLYTRQSISLTSSHVERWPTSARQSTDYVIHQLALRRPRLDTTFLPSRFSSFFYLQRILLLSLGESDKKKREENGFVLAPVDGRENTRDAPGEKSLVRPSGRSTRRWTD